MTYVLIMTLLLISPTVFGLTSMDPVQEAHACLTRLPANPEPRDTDTCLVPIEGITSSSAENIRCAISFIREGFDSQRLTDISEANSRGRSDPRIRLHQVLSLLSFTSGGQSLLDLARAETTFESCSGANNKTSALISAFSVMQMSLVHYLMTKGACSSESPTIGPKGYSWYNLSECLTTAESADLASLTNPNTSDSDAIAAQLTAGQAAIKAYEENCATSDIIDFCGSLKDTVDLVGRQGSPREVATRFFLRLL